MSDRTDYYAEAMYRVATAEDATSEVLDELFRFSRVLEANDDLVGALGDPHINVERRLQIVEDLLAGKASAVTVSLVSLVVLNGRTGELSKIVESLLDLAAASGEKVVAEVTSAVELTDDQKRRLAEALKQSTGHDVEIVVVVDPTVIGGVVTRIGDTVIDGSVRHRLAQLRESF